MVLTHTFSKLDYQFSLSSPFCRYPSVFSASAIWHVILDLKSGGGRGGGSSFPSRF